MISWVDTHCHLQLAGEDAAALLDRASAVEWVVAPGVDADTSEAGRRLAARFPGRVLATAGLHPHEAASWGRQGGVIGRLAVTAAAVGETGLDFYRNLSPPDAQVDAFRRQLDLAAQLDKTVIVHCRDAFERVHQLVEAAEAGPRCVLHCWTGGPRWTRRFLELGVMFSFAGPVAFPTGDTVRRGAALVPPDRAMVETDTPYLSPPPHQGEPNEPARVALVGAALARVWGVEVAEVASVTTANAVRMFRS